MISIYKDVLIHLHHLLAESGAHVTMSTFMFVQMVWSHEGLSTELADKLLDSSVNSLVPWQLITSENRTKVKGLSILWKSFLTLQRLQYNPHRGRWKASLQYELSCEPWDGTAWSRTSCLPAPHIWRACIFSPKHHSASYNSPQPFVPDSLDWLQKSWWQSACC